MQSTTTKRAVVIADCTNLGMNEEQPTQGGEFSCATKPAICIPPSVSACYRRSHRRRPSRDLPAESVCFDVEHDPVSGPVQGTLSVVHRSVEPPRRVPVSGSDCGHGRLAPGSPSGGRRNHQYQANALTAAELSMTPCRISSRPSGSSRAGMIKYVTASSANAASRGKAGADTSRACAPSWSAGVMIDHGRRQRSGRRQRGSVEDHSCAKSRCCWYVAATHGRCLHRKLGPL